MPDINKMERGMEGVLDKEAKLKRDAKNLILISVGKQDIAINRGVKAMLGERDKEVLINNGAAYSKEYKELLNKEVMGNYWKNEKRVNRLMDTQKEHKTLVENSKLNEAKLKYKEEAKIPIKVRPK